MSWRAMKPLFREKDYGGGKRKVCAANGTGDLVVINLFPGMVEENRAVLDRRRVMCVSVCVGRWKERQQEAHGSALCAQ